MPLSSGERSRNAKLMARLKKWRESQGLPTGERPPRPHNKRLDDQPQRFHTSTYLDLPGMIARSLCGFNIVRGR